MIKNNFMAKIVSGEELDAKTRIFKAGLEEFAVCSPKAARTREIAAKANVNHAAISYYFGGKDELYMEITRQITEFIKAYTAEYFERSKAVFESANPDDALNLLIDFISHRVCAECENTKIFRCVILIITREELYQSTKAFEMFYNEVFSPSIEMASKLVEIASRGKHVGVEAKVIAEMIMGQVHMFNSSRSGLKRANNWQVFGEQEVAETKRIFADLVKKFLVENV